MKGLIFLFILTCLSGVQVLGQCTSEYNNLTSCIVSALEDQQCTFGQYCESCENTQMVYSNCTCTEDDTPGGYQQCVSDCVDFAICVSQANYNSSLNCDSPQNAYVNCLNSADSKKIQRIQIKQSSPDL
eukprot:TRINITY_DN4144_c0_g1_i1.p1 TRINITY_DN4144_c0_g1~~TRINITY_DN4144_c0_g1_i1.p1  ORF type:complete len:129 (-),score=0.71 TRINITY_DN4144_c0_g1_i1:185-571(-)